MGAEMSTLPNILLVMTDQQRWDALGMAGRFPVRTPNLERLAADGVWFRRTYVQAPLCVPSRASVLTGRYPHQHGCHNNDNSPWPTSPSFVRQLRDAGYLTANVGKLHYTWFHDVELLTADPLLRAMGFVEPLETTGKMSAGNLRASAYSEHLRSRGLLEMFHLDLMARVKAGPVLGAGPSILGETDHVDGWVMNRANQWLQDAGPEPFFLWVGPEGPHDPFDPPAPWAKMYDVDDIPEGPSDRPIRVLRNAYHGELSNDVTPGQVRQMRAHYLGNVSYIDDWVGHLLATLERRGMLANTWVFFCSDHGEMLGDHRLMGKAKFFEPAVRVPLIVRPPDSVDFARGTVRDCLVELLDVPATILDIAGTDLPGGQGRSLRGLLDRDAEDKHRDVAVSQLGEIFMITDGVHKVELDGDGRPWRAFDLADDPDEVHDLVDDDVPWIADLVEQARQFRSERPADMPEPWNHLRPHQHWGRNLLKECTTANGWSG